MNSRALVIQPLKWLALLLSVTAVIVSIFAGLEPSPGFLFDYLSKALSGSWSYLVDHFKMNSYLFWIPVAGIFLAERLIPARRGQKIFSIGLFQDLAWFVCLPMFGALLVWRFRSFFSQVYEHYFNFVSIEILHGLPLPLQVILVILASDFLTWLAHLIKHKVNLFWHFHAVHHSQTEMNFLTDKRVHPVGNMISFVIMFFPLTLLELEHAVPLGIFWWFFTTWHTMIYHANIRTNYGILRYVFVTPQSHRIHHSSQPQHRDHNFGVIFSFWDRLFGTQYKGYDEYPDTGIEDRNFPMERAYGLWDLIVTLLRQLVYPFKMILH